jgi:hypothetical protein
MSPNPGEFRWRLWCYRHGRIPSGRHAPCSDPNTTARESFTASMRLLGKASRGRLSKILRPLLGRAQADENLREAVRTRWVEPRRQVAREIVRRAMQTGELRAGLDPDVVLDALYGLFYHRLLVPYKNGVYGVQRIEAKWTSV